MFIYNFHTPSDVANIASTEQPLQTIILEGLVLNPYLVNEPFSLLMNEGRNNPPESSYFNYSASSLFLASKVLVLERSEQEFTPDTDYTILLELPPSAILRLRVSGNDGKYREIALNDPIGDVLESGESKVFRLPLILKNNLNNTNPPTVILVNNSN